MWRIEFVAPTRPVSVNQTMRSHWAKNRSLLKPWKEAAHVAAVTQQNFTGGPEGLRKSEVLVYLPFTTDRRRDPHNYVGTNVKAVIDGLVSAGVWKDDNSDYVIVLEPVLMVTPPGLPQKVYIEIEEVA